MPSDVSLSHDVVTSTLACIASVAAPLKNLPSDPRRLVWFVLVIRVLQGSSPAVFNISSCGLINLSDVGGLCVGLYVVWTVGRWSKNSGVTLAFQRGAADAGSLCEG